MNKKDIYKYLGMKTSGDQKTEDLIDECILEVEKIARFKAIHKMLTLEHQPLRIVEWDLLLESKDLELYFENCSQCMVVAGTLGIQVDKQVRLYEHIDMSKAVVFNAVCNHYLELCMDKYEEGFSLKKRTFRFCPGYGDFDISYNQKVYQYMKLDKILGLSLNESSLLIPLKSMIGFIGIGENKEKSCFSCIRKEECELRKGGQRCYKIN